MVTEDKPQTQFLKYIRTVGMTTMRGRGFYYPVDSAMNNDGRIYTVSRSAEKTTGDTIRVTMLNEEGEYFGIFGSKGNENGQFMWPCGIAVDSNDRVYVTDEYLHQISIFNESGEFLNKWGSRGTEEGLLDAPSGIAHDLYDNVYISDSRNHRIQKFSKDGDFIHSFGSYGCEDGEFNLPWGLFVTNNSEVFVADWGNDRIQRFTSDGKFIAKYGSAETGKSEFTRPAGITVDKNGYMYVADWGNEMVKVLDTNGKCIQTLRGEATHSKWAEDFLKINLEEAQAREKANLEPEIQYFNEDPHEESSHIEKLFWGPVSVLLDSEERLFITETNRHRIQVYERTNW
tara:strand:- start:2185 stop:3216 length:1032 start_codon:yes stop_codon:yes gene_type:complete